MKLCHGCQHRITFAGGYLEYVTKSLEAEIKRTSYFQQLGKRVSDLEIGESLSVHFGGNLERYSKTVKGVSERDDTVLRLQVAKSVATVSRLSPEAIQ